MTLTEIEYFSLCARTLTSMYSGDPLALTPFLRTIELLKSLDTANEHEEVLKNYVLSKLQGTAIECLPQNPSLETIINTLKEKIKPENSKVLAGKMMAIRADKANFTEYTKRTELLAEKLMRSLVLE